MMKQFKSALFILLALTVFSCSKNKTWSCECQDSAEDHGVFEGSQKEAEKWCGEKKGNNDCILVGHK